MNLTSRLPVRAAAAAVLAVAGLAFSAGEAKAACGDYVRVEGGPSAPPAPTVPCHGPGCSKAPRPVPPLTAPVPAPAGHEQLASVHDQVCDPHRAARWPHPPVPGDRPVRCTSPIFHPPRAG